MIGNSITAERDDAETEYFFMGKIFINFFLCTSDIISDHKYANRPRI